MPLHWQAQDCSCPSGANRLLEPVRRRLAGDVPLEEAFYNDMLAVGSIINIVIGLCAFAMISANFPIWIPIVVFLLPQPYNILLLISVWRSAADSQARGADLVKIAAIFWFLVMIFV